MKIMRNMLDTDALYFYYIFSRSRDCFYLFIVFLLSNFSLAIASGPTAPGFNT